MTFAEVSPERLQPGRSLLLVTVLLAGLLAACGGSDGDDSDDGSSGGANSGATSGSSPGASEGAAAADSSDDESSGDGTASGDPDDAAPSSVFLEGCDALIFIFQVRETDSEVPFDVAADALRDMGQVESSIQADLQLVSEAYEPFFDLLRELSVDNLAEYNDLDEETSSRIESAVLELETSEVRAATNNINDFIDEEC